MLANAYNSEIFISNRRARALLAMLCVIADNALKRDYISKLLWLGRFQARAWASLRQCLLSLDKLLTPIVGPLLDVSPGHAAAVPRLDAARRGRSADQRRR